MPLTDLRVVDLTRILAGPFATMMLGDMGAEVLKIERPGVGDDARGWGPPFVDGISTYFLSVNRNKRSITLDLKSETGQELLWELVESADVLVSNFRVGVMESLGFGYEEVARRAPKCVYAVINGYGASGPRATKPAFDIAIQAESGLMDLTGFSDGRPTKVGISIADEIAGMYVVQGILLALLERQRTDRGQLVEVALHDAMLSMFTFQAQRYLSTGERPQRMGNRHPSIAPYETFEAADGTVVVASQDSNVYVVDADSGRQLLMYSTGYQRFGGGPTIDGDTVYISSARGWIWAIDRLAKSYPGQRKFWRLKINLYVWQIMSTRPIQPGGLWSKRVGGQVKGLLAIAHGVVYGATGKGKIFAHDGDTGQKKWSTQLKVKVSTSPSIAGDTVLVGTEEGKIFGLDAANGDVLWQFQAGEGEIVESPVVAGDTIYVASVDGTLYAITGGD
ncbi:MAG: CoA transferase [Gemmatimonadetes bacterium]|nr:CoA transferase [Gemmatimonadota bacterium]